MKKIHIAKFLILIFSVTFLISFLESCKTGRGAVSPAYSAGGKPSKRSFRTLSGGSSGNGGSMVKSRSTIAKPKPMGRVKNSSVSGTNTKELVDIEAGTLTAGELTDFDRWDFWESISESEFKFEKEKWHLHPEERAVIQLQYANGLPVVDATIIVRDSLNVVVWESKTDNTGKAECFYSASTTEFDIISQGIIKTEKRKLTPFKNGINHVKLTHIPVFSNNVDIAFVVDATGSMKDEIEYLKVELEDIINQTKTTFPKFELNLGSVFYRCTGNEYSLRSSNLDSDISKTVNFIQQQKASEGGDEIVDSAFYEAMENLTWRDEARSRILFWVLDEPPSSGSLTLENLKKYTLLAAKKGVRVVPIIGSGMGMPVTLEYLMRSIAIHTNGSYVFLTDHSGVGDAHAEPTVDEYDVELLNKLILRTIYEYTYIPTLEVDVNLNVDTVIVKEVITHVVLNDTNKLISDSTEIIYDTLNLVFEDTAFTEIDSLLVEKDSIIIDEPDYTIVNEIKIYPNPTAGQLKIEVIGDADFVYFADISGKILERWSLPESGLIETDISKYPNGMYSVQCLSYKKWLSGKVILSK